MKSICFSIFLLLLLVINFSSWSNDNLDLGIPSCNGQLVDRIGYAFLYSEKHEQPLWVSYKLTKTELHSKVTKRKDNFRLDPDIKTGSAILSDYKNSGYDRGHLAPAADMAWSNKAMSDSFFLTNISPQVPAFNRGIWRILEEQVRKWTLQDQELYIITGPVIQPNYKTIGSSEVTVPQWYYKIIVDYHQPEIKALAFMIPNQKTNKSLRKFAISIDEIEKKTQLDFLSLVPQKLQIEIESQVNLSQWIFQSTKSGKTEKNKMNRRMLKSANKMTELVVSEKELGGINTNTPFRKNKIQELFPNFDIIKDVSNAEGEIFPIFRIKKYGQDILVINPTTDRQHIFSIQIKSEIVKNELGSNLGSTYHEIYGDQPPINNCSSGIEEQSGKVICSASGSEHIIYVFSGKWHGPDSVLPPTEILQSWKLIEIVWKP